MNPKKISEFMLGFFNDASLLDKPAYDFENARRVNELYQITNARLEWMISKSAFIHTIERGDKTLYVVLDKGGAMSGFCSTPYAAIDEAMRIFPLSNLPLCESSMMPR